MKVYILYGTQTGNAESIAQLLQDQAQERGLEPECMTLDDFAKKKIAQTDKTLTLVIVTSTYGDGDYPDTAGSFKRWVRRPTPASLVHINYTVFALGDSNYSTFCGCGRDIDKKMDSHGAKRYMPREEADDAMGLESFVDPWCAKLWAALDKLSKEGAEGTSKAKEDGLPPPTLSGAPEVTGEQREADVTLPTTLVEAPIVAARWLTPKGTGRDVIQATVAVPDSLVWEPGAAIAVYVSNTEAEVSKVLSLLGLTGDEPFKPSRDGLLKKRLQQAEAQGRTISSREVLTHHIALRVHSRAVLQLLLAHVNALTDKDASNMASAEDAKTLRLLLEGTEWRGALMLSDLLVRCPTARPDWVPTIESLSLMQPRYYSVASERETHPGQLSIVFRLQPGGLATTWLAEQCEAYGRGPGTPVTIPLALKPTNEFKLPPAAADTTEAPPLILIGPGTGVAPFIAFLQRLGRLRAAGEKQQAYLFFGCRGAEEYLFREELVAFKESGILTELHTVFSREQQEGGNRYVQDSLIEHAERIADLILRRGAFIYVCGDAARMAADVHAALVKVLESHNSSGWTAGRCAAHLDELSAAGRYQRDVWST